MSYLLKLFVLLLFTSQLLNASNTQLTKVSLQLQWKHQFEFAGFYIAKEKGFYKEKGLDVDIKEFESSMDVADEVSNGIATFGTTYPSVILKESNGANLTLLGAILQTSPHVLVSLDSSGIKEITDFKNKTIMINNNEAITASFLSMLKVNGVSLDEMKKINETFNIYDLIEKRTDIKTAFTSNELFYLDKKNIKYKIWDPKDYGFYFYDVMLFTSKDYFKKNKTIVDDFTQASIKGWEYAFNNIEESVDLILKKYNSQTKTKEALIYEANVLKKLAYHQTTQLGVIDIDKVKHIFNIYSILGLTKNKIDWDSFIYEGALGKDNAIEKNITLNKKEKKFIEEHPKIILGGDSSWEPYLILNSDGNVEGLDADFIKKINELTGLNITFELGRWSDMVEKAQKKQIDGLTTSAVHKEREKYFNFSIPYSTLNQVAVVKAGNPKSINNKSDLEGKKLGILKGNLQMKKFANSIGNVTMVYYDNAVDILKGLISEDIDAIVTSEIAIYLATKEGLRNYIEIASIVGEPTKHVFSLRNDWPELTSIVNKALNHISEQEKQEFRTHWLGQISQNQPQSKKIILLNKEEQAYLDKKSSLKICVDPDFLPYEEIDESGEYQGIGSEIFTMVSKSLGKPLELVPTNKWSESLTSIKNKNCDILPMAASTNTRQEYLNFTKPYIKDSVVVATNEDQFFINNSNDLSNRKIGVVEGYPFKEQLQKAHPTINVVEVKNAIDGLTKVKHKELYGYVDALSVIAYNIQNNRLIDLKVAGKLEFDLHLSIATRNDEPLLATIMSKALQKLDKEQIRAIQGKWISIKVEQSFNYRILIYITIVFLIIVALLIHRQNYIKKTNKKLEKISITDALTNIYNRRYFNEIFPKVINSAKRDNDLVSFLIMDIDHFKQYNDTYGHQMGDEVLEKVAKALKVSLHRADDYCFRLGGEEFGMIFKSDTKHKAKEFANSIRKNIESLEIEHEKSSASKYVTASIGLIVKNAHDIIDDKVIYKEADELLYKAKQNGRNRVEYI